MVDESDPEVIRQQMEVQRAALTQKLETLENRIVETVEGAREAVAETVQTVKDSVKDSVDTVKETVHSSVETVKETFDLERQVDRHPWPMFAGSVAVGFVAGWLMRRAGIPQPVAPTSFVHAPPVMPRAPAAPYVPAAPAASSSESSSSWLHDVAHTLSPEIDKIKGLAIGTLMGVLRDMVTEPLPEEVRPRVNEIADSITVKLGGAPVEREVIDQLLPRRQDDRHNGHHRAPEEQFRR